MVLKKFLRRFSPVHLCHQYILRGTRRRVFQGPFEGMLYVRKSVGSSYWPKLLGTYEHELHPVWARLVERPFRKAVVIGAGEGYYAVGLALKWKLNVTAYEPDEDARNLMTNLGLINRCTVQIKGAFTSKSPSALNYGLVVVDIEGAELHLLDARRFQEWKSCVIIAEVHSPAIKAMLLERSKATHQSEFVPVEPRTMNDYPFQPPFAWLLRRWWVTCLQEWRSESIGWLIFEPHTFVT
jgi:hypothetical protein